MPSPLRMKEGAKMAVLEQHDMLVEDTGWSPMA